MTKIKTLIEFVEYFKDEATCLEYITASRFRNGAYCVHCQSPKVYKLSTRNLYKCSTCQKQFSIKVGTIFTDSKVPLKKWLLAIYIMTFSKGISSIQLSKQLGVTQKTAWFMCHRIRKAHINKNGSLLGGVIEIDETYIGGKEKNKHSNKRLAHSQGGANKEAVLGMVEREGKLKLKQIGHTDRYTVKQVIDDAVSKEAIVITDEAKVYDKILGKRDRRLVNHSKKEFVNGDIYTNTIEGAFSIVKRTIYGIYHFTSRKHLQRYLTEIAFRYNNRDITNFDMFNLCIYNINDTLSYKELTE